MSKDFVFDLTATEGAYSLSPGSNLFEDEIDIVLKWIEVHYNKVRLNIKSYNQHDAILISGKRGAGKSTFLQIIKSRIESSEYKNKICVLPILDPTLVDGDDIFLAVVIASILNVVSEKKNNTNDSYFIKIKKDLNDLTSKLRVLDYGVRQKIMQDTSSNVNVFGDQIMNMAITGIDIKNCFEKFVKSVIDFLEIEHFVLFLDDVDIDFASGYRVLETVRRYFVNGRILPILSGDLELFQLVVRERVWERLENLRNSEQEKNRKDQIYSQVGNLEGQYLLKILRPERRLFLPSPIEKIKYFYSKGKNVLVKMDSNSYVKLDDILKKINQYIFVVHENDKSEVLPSPACYIFTDNTRQLRAALKWIAGQYHWLESNEHPPDGLAKEILNLHANIHETKINTDIIDAIWNGDFSPLALWVWENKKIPDLYRLDPSRLNNENSDSPWKIVILSIQAALIERFRKDSGAVLRYLGVVISPALAMQRSEPDQIPQQWRVGIKQPAWYASACVTGWLERQITDDWQFESFGLRFRRKSSKSYRDVTRSALNIYKSKNQKDHSTQLWLKHCSDADDIYQFPSEPRWQHIVGVEAQQILGWYRVILAQSSGSIHFIDPWSGFVAIGDYVTDNLYGKKKNISSFVYNRETLIVYNKPYGKIPKDVEDEDVEYMEYTEENLDNTLQKAMNEWMDSKELCVVNPSVLGDIGNRFMSGQVSLKENMQIIECSVGEVLRRWCLIWINAIIVSEGTILKNNEWDERNINSFSGENISPIIKNINIYNSLDENLKKKFILLNWIKNCPLIVSFIGDGILNKLVSGKNLKTNLNIKNKINTYIDVYDALCALTPYFGKFVERSSKVNLVIHEENSDASLKLPDANVLNEDIEFLIKIDRNSMTTSNIGKTRTKINNLMEKYKHKMMELSLAKIPPYRGNMIECRNAIIKNSQLMLSMLQKQT